MEDIALGFGAGIITVLVFLEIAAAAKRMNILAFRQIQDTPTSEFFNTAFKEEDFNHFVGEHFGGTRNYSHLLASLEKKREYDPQHYMKYVRAITDGAIANHCIRCSGIPPSPKAPGYTESVLKNTSTPLLLIPAKTRLPLKADLTRKIALPPKPPAARKHSKPKHALRAKSGKHKRK
ncbi:MAG: hypothetical protein V1887_00340 [Candidatus Aenigmatarchaeota archaeon]